MVSIVTSILFYALLSRICSSHSFLVKLAEEEEEKDVNELEETSTSSFPEIKNFT
jgi:hypothetical protein